jgi:hypothetical protein
MKLYSGGAAKRRRSEEVMKKSTKTIELKFEQTIPASPSEVYDARLNPKIPGNPWNRADKLTLNPKVDGFFFGSRGISTLRAIY